MPVVVFEEASADAPRGSSCRLGPVLAHHAALPVVRWPAPLADAALVIACTRAVAEAAVAAEVPVILLAGATQVCDGLVEGIVVVRAPTAFVRDVPADAVLAAMRTLSSRLVKEASSHLPRPPGTRIAELGHGGRKLRQDSVGVDLVKCHPRDWIGDPRDLWFFERDTFDTVVVHPVFTAPADRAAALAEAERITRPGGSVWELLGDPRGVPSACRQVTKGRSAAAPGPTAAPEVSVLIVAEHSGDAGADARQALGTARSAHRSLAGVAHEVLILMRAPVPGAESAALRELAREVDLRVLHDTRPLTWPRRAELLRGAARASALVLLAPGLEPAPMALAELHARATAGGPGVVVPAPAAAGDLTAASFACAWISADHWPAGLGTTTAHQTQLFLTTLGIPRVADAPAIAFAGGATKPLTATRVAPWRFDLGLPRAAAPVRKVLVVCLRSFGDCVLATAPLAALRKRYPGAEITILTEAPYAPLFTSDPAVDVVLAAPRCADDQIFWHEDMLVCEALAAHGPYDRLALLSDRLDNLAYFHAGVPMHGFYSIQAGVPEGASHAPALALAAEHREAARVRLAQHGITGRYAVVHTQAGWAEKTPPRRLFEQVVEELAGVHGLPVVVVGGPGELEHPRALTLAGRQSLLESLGVIAGAWLYVGPDSGSLHAASAFDVPSLGIYAGTAMRVSPLYSQRAIAVQSSACCALPCGTSPCRERQPCAEAIAIEHLRPHLAHLARGEAGRSEWLGHDPALWIHGPAGATLVMTNALGREPLAMPELPRRRVTPRATPLAIRELSCALDAAALGKHQRAYLALRDRLIPEAGPVRYRDRSKETIPWRRPSAPSATS